MFLGYDNWSAIRNEKRNKTDEKKKTTFGNQQNACSSRSRARKTEWNKNNNNET